MSFIFSSFHTFPNWLWVQMGSTFGFELRWGSTLELKWVPLLALSSDGVPLWSSDGFHSYDSLSLAHPRSTNRLPGMWSIRCMHDNRLSNPVRRKNESSFPRCMQICVNSNFCYLSVWRRFYLSVESPTLAPREFEDDEKEDFGLVEESLAGLLPPVQEP